jgi:hypothetical protein
MPHIEETRLIAVVTKSQHLYHAAWSALVHPVHSVITGSDAHLLLMGTERAASEQYKTDEAALRAWRQQMPPVSGAGSL